LLFGRARLGRRGRIREFGVLPQLEHFAVLPLLAFLGADLIRDARFCGPAARKRGGGTLRTCAGYSVSSRRQCKGLGETDVTDVRPKSAYTLFQAHPLQSRPWQRIVIPRER
jgi:hypothetical protein